MPDGFLKPFPKALPNLAQNKNEINHRFRSTYCKNTQKNLRLRTVVVLQKFQNQELNLGILSLTAAAAGHEQGGGEIRVSRPAVCLLLCLRPPTG